PSTRAGAAHPHGFANVTPPAPPPGPKTSRPRKPGPLTDRPRRPAPGPVRVRIVYRPVGATVLAPAQARTPADTAAPADAFDALYRRSAADLRRQVAVLTGDRALAGRAVQRAFDAAWQQWPEVARDSDPVGWVRAAAHTYALAPWQQRLPGRRKARPTAGAGLPQALVRLRPERRRALLLHDGLGLTLAETAAEAESSTTAAASRIIGARRELAAAAPDDYDGGDATALLAALLAAEPDVPDDAPSGVRAASERGTRRRTAGVLAMAGGLVLATLVCMVAGPQQAAPPPRGPAHQQRAEQPAGT
uniref:RNA polymerase sigma factor n=1 Tax=Streptomyces sp. IBSBF 2435 TaxID=2903531 RepID=UPI003FA72433